MPAIKTLAKLNAHLWCALCLFTVHCELCRVHYLESFPYGLVVVGNLLLHASAEGKSEVTIGFLQNSLYCSK